jgi:PadR family transcriptional regulator, regulatory protein PadR
VTAKNLFIDRVAGMRGFGRVTPAALDVLAVLIAEPGHTHGFAIARQAQHPTGSVYPILARLENAGWVQSHRETTNPTHGKPPRRLYRLTCPEGLHAAQALLDSRRPQ